MTYQRLSACLLALSAVACGAASSEHAGTSHHAHVEAMQTEVSTEVADATEPTTSPLETLPRLESAHEIRDASTWRRLCARPTSSTVARTEVVKFLVDLQDERRIWFVDTERWDIHYFFARDRLSSVGHTVEGHGDFNVQEYRREDRRFEMGSVVHYLDSDLWTMELVSGDTLSGERIVRLFQQIQGAVWTGEHLRFHPVSPVHEASIEPVRDRIPTIASSEVFAGIQYEPLTRGTAFGTLRIVRGPLDLASVRPDEIVVLELLPDEIPVVSAIVSAQMQAPLGHIAVLSATRQTPNMGLRTALSDPQLAALDGQLVALTVAPQEWSVRPATLTEAEASWSTRRPTAPVVPSIDASDATLRQLCEVRLGDVDTVGAKAAQLGEACSIGGSIRTPGGFTIPFHHYLGHLETSHVASTIAPMLADTEFRADGHHRETALAELRARIEEAPVDAALIQNVQRRIRATAPDARWILRSSTNAEDLAGFTGAGLYRSIVIPAHATDAQVADALRQVWASVWLLGAYEEREWYRVPHERVAMAVLAQPFIDGAMINGVAITQNPFYEGRPGYFINAQALGGSVTGATGDEVPEQHLIYTYMETPEYELLSRSSRGGGAALLTELDLLHLTNVLRVLHEHFEPRWTGEPNAVDVEFLVAGEDRHIVVLQARPYTVRWGEGQRWE
jgi:hypothetical protein